MKEEIKEIMNGNREIRRLKIEGETLGFDTQFHNDWNFMPRDIEQIIYTLQEENKSLQSQLKAKEEVIETIKKQLYNAINILKDVDDETNKIIKECMTGTLSQIIELEEILSKGENK